MKEWRYSGAGGDFNAAECGPGLGRMENTQPIEHLFPGRSSSPMPQGPLFLFISSFVVIIFPLVMVYHVHKRTSKWSRKMNAGIVKWEDFDVKGLFHEMPLPTTDTTARIYLFFAQSDK